MSAPKSRLCKHRDLLSGNSHTSSSGKSAHGILTLPTDPKKNINACKPRHSTASTDLDFQQLGTYGWCPNSPWASNDPLVSPSLFSSWKSHCKGGHVPYPWLRVRDQHGIAAEEGNWEIKKETAGPDKIPSLPLVKQDVSGSGTDGMRIHSMANPEEVEKPEIKSLWLQLCLSDSPTQSWTEQITGDHSSARPIHKGKNFPSWRVLTIEL